MVKKKILKLKVGEVYIDGVGTKNVYKTYWKNEDGSYEAQDKIWVNEVEVKPKTEKPSECPEA